MLFFIEAAACCWQRLQSLQLQSGHGAGGGGGGGGGEPKFYHYCYICNTQLNSCKQALLHCSGKRHRKKLQFLQARKTTLGQISPTATIGAAPALPPSPHDTTGLLYHPHHPPVNAPYGNLAPPPYPPPPPPPDGSGLVPGGPPPPPPGATYYSPAPPPMLNPSPEWYPQSVVYPMPHPPLPAHVQQHMAANIPPGTAIYYSSSCGSSSPLVLTDFSYGSPSSYSGGARSAVISPSETSSISSESLPSKNFKCHVCQRHFQTTAQLHAHLQTARHYRPGGLPNTATSTLQQEDNVTLKKADETSETEESSVSESPSFQCISCANSVKEDGGESSSGGGGGEGGGEGGDGEGTSKQPQPTPIDSTPSALTSPAGPGIHPSSTTASPSQRHKSRISTTAQQTPRKKSRSSSTSSEPTEFIMDSGYCSGSGDDIIVCVSQPTTDRPTPKFRCQLCNIYLNSPAQAQQHVSSQKHQIRVSGNKSNFRRRPFGSYRKRQSNPSSGGTTSGQVTPNATIIACNSSTTTIVSTSCSSHSL